MFRQRREGHRFAPPDGDRLDGPVGKAGLASGESGASNRVACARVSGPRNLIASGSSLCSSSTSYIPVDPDAAVIYFGLRLVPL